LAAFTTQLAAPHISGKNGGCRTGNVRQLQEIMVRCAMKRSRTNRPGYHVSYQGNDNAKAVPELADTEWVERM